MDIDLFGAKIVERPRHGRGGYAALPGTGPKSETCRSCKHYRSVKYHDKTYPKCILMFDRWTHGSGSDIKAKSPACQHWTFKTRDDDKFDLFRPPASIQRR